MPSDLLDHTAVVLPLVLQELGEQPAQLGVPRHEAHHVGRQQVPGLRAGFDFNKRIIGFQSNTTPTNFIWNGLEPLCSFLY